MLITVDPTDPRAIYVQIMDEVRRALVLGTLAPGDPLPSVRQLAVELRVNPNTVAQAYRELERQSVVHVRRGQGTYVSEASRNGADRRALAREVAVRALREAHRNGLGAEELIEAIRAADTQPQSEESPP
jgi:GntR family transcriptional regulator